MDLSESIKSAEDTYRQNLEDFFNSVYNERSLPSHGIDHHRRVWGYSKELLDLFPFSEAVNIQKLANNLILACYMHDIGMSVDPGVKHGTHSRYLCVKFFQRHNLPVSDFKEVLEAVENHDNKEYSGNDTANDLLAILSVSDDLDAFGYIGIYRYSEIYLARGIEPEKIGHQIRDNVEKRFRNFIKSIGTGNKITDRHSVRYNTIDRFFRKYNEQLPSYNFGSSHPYGYCGLIELFGHMMDRRIELKEIYLEPERYLVDPTIRWFFTELEKELGLI
jgi:HD superfamily phosphodiesterase